jgi:hypothetical protein
MNSRYRVKWAILLCVSTLVAVWRLVDFGDEAVNGSLHINRGGLALIGKDATAAELIIIVAALAVAWLAIVKLSGKSYKPKWALLLFVSSLVVIWRSVDFVYEAVHGAFRFTRGGLGLTGTGAALTELSIILAALGVAWMSTRKLSH